MAGGRAIRRGGIKLGGAQEKACGRGVLSACLGCTVDKRVRSNRAGIRVLGWDSCDFS